jgi:hypothetical protein
MTFTPKYSPYPEIQAALNKAAFIVEATDDERFLLWKDHALHEKCKYVKSWEQIMFGYWQPIGEIDNRPICISLSFAIIGGIYVMFASMTSQLQDYKMMEDWLTQYCPAYSDRRNNTTDATNFGHICHKIA